MQIANNPLFIEDLSAEANQVMRGSTTKRRIKVKNLGDKKADIDIWIVATDEKSDPLLRWCSFSEQNPLKLEPRESREVTLYFDVPHQATPGFYNYEILIQAEFAYPDKTFSRRQQLRVSLSDRDAEFGNEPGFIIQPFTSSANPYPLAAGESLELKVKVENRSKRVDRFYLACPELTPDWYTIHYPESSLQIPGLVRETDGLELNPERTGEIKLILHPPNHTLAGNYFPTIRLISSNKEDLVLLDVVYLQVLPNETLNVELHPLILKVPSQNQGFEVKLLNQGNINREIAIFAKDKEEIFTYTPEFPSVRISPGETISVPLKTKPRKWWRRPLKGKPLEFIFNVEVENNPALLLPETTKSPALPKQLPQGTVVWETRPWWQFWLPLALLILLALGLISVSAFLWWQQYIVKPKISKLEPIQKVYQEFNNQPITLKFEINHRQYWQFKHWKFQRYPKLDKISITPISREGTGKVISYNYNQLMKLCQPQQNTFSCQNISTETTKAGSYTFKIDVFPQRQNKPSDSKQTDTIIIEPTPALPVPKIIEFSPTKKLYQETLKEQIILNWKISHPNQIKSVTLIQQPSNGSPVKTTFNQCPPLQPTTSNVALASPIVTSEFIICQGIATNVTKGGDYTFKLEVLSKQDDRTPADTKETDTISIQPLPPLPVPKIEGFSTSKPVYESKEPVVLTWKILNPSQVKEVKIIEQGNNSSITKKAFDIKQCTPEKLQTSTPPLNNQSSITPAPAVLVCKYTIPPAKAGSYTYKVEVVSKQDENVPVASKETDTISVKPTPIPPLPQISEFSSTQPFYEQAKNEEVLLNWTISNIQQIKELRLVGLGLDGSIVVPLKILPINNNLLPSVLSNFCKVNVDLTCQNVPTDAKKSGDYVFKLTVIPKQKIEGSEITKNTATIGIKPVPPKIIYLKVNGRDVTTQRKISFPIGKRRGEINVILSWKVERGEGLKVELLGSSVEPEGSISYLLSKPPSSQTITLKVTNKAGEEKSQSVVVETVESNQSIQVQPPSNNLPRGTVSPSNASGTPSQPSQLSPMELPPQPD
ncbi:MAG TPA: hypothetical protein V6D28_16095 [Leptolyngbyaceae cyanobacterium]